MCSTQPVIHSRHGSGLLQFSDYRQPVEDAATEFNLQPYTGNNVLLATDTNNHTLALATPGQFQSLNILDAAANGASTFTVTLNFATGAPTVVTGQTAPDWFSRERICHQRTR